MRDTSYISPYPVIDRREKIRVKIDLQRLEYQDTTGYYEEIRHKMKLWKKRKDMRVFQRWKINIGEEKMRMEEDRLKKAVTKERRRLRQSKRFWQRI